MDKKIFVGGFRFCLASLIVFATVAFAERWMYVNLGLYGAYLVWTIMFIGLGGAALKPLTGESISTKRFYAVFSIGFFLYAAGWMAVYFVMRDGLGEWVASLLSSTMLGLTFAVGLKEWPQALRFCLILFITNSVGYFLGDALNDALGGKTGMLLWGASYGIFLGAGFGGIFYLSTPAK